MSASGTEAPSTQGHKHWTHRAPDRIRRGSKHPAAKLDESEVERIRWRAEGGASTVKLARMFGVNKETIRRIVRRETWRHL